MKCSAKQIATVQRFAIAVMQVVATVTTWKIKTFISHEFYKLVYARAKPAISKSLTGGDWFDCFFSQHVACIYLCIECVKMYFQVLTNVNIFKCLLYYKMKMAFKVKKLLSQYYPNY